jgi:NAD(P)-dependent dehydrogenase (short-subunit alcohol dehydrogenase family)
MTSVLVAGGASGIGAAAVRGFRERGDAVVVADLDLERAQAVAARTCRSGRGAAVRPVDGRRAGAAVAAAVEHGGGLDVVFGNAGLLRAAPLAEWTVESWDLTMALNLRTPFLLAQAARRTCGRPRWRG